MMKQTLLAALLVLASTAQAQNNCPCNGGVGTRLTGTTDPTLGAALAGKMVCAAVGNERWQGWHSGTAAGGDLWDFKRGPTDAVDPSTKTGTYRFQSSTLGAKVARSTASSDTVVYDYGSGGSYRYAVCRVSASSYALCGAALGGRDISPVMVGGNGTLQSCDSLLRDSGAKVQPKSK
jgi:hypothetical protein